MSLLERHEEILDKCVQSLNTWKELIAEYFDDNEKDTEFEKLKKVVGEYCEIDKNFRKSERALEKVEENLGQNEESAIIDVDKLYEENLEEEPQSSTHNYQNSNIWQKVFTGFDDVVEVKKKKSKIDDTQYEELGDSLLCSNVFTPPIDPISKTVIRNPYKSKRCKHAYEHSTIVGYIKQLKNKARCPYIGCNNNQLRLSDLVEDKALRTQVTSYLESQRDSSSEDD